MKRYLHSLILATLVLQGLVTAPTQASTPPKQPVKVIALSPHIVELLFAIGAGEQIIATSEFADYPQAAQKLPRVGNYLNLQLERILELKPDVILAWKDGSPANDLARLKELGMRIVYSQPKRFEDIASDVIRFGELTGHLTKAQQLATQFLSRLAKLRQQYQGKTRLEGFYELWHQPLTTIAQNSWPQQHLDICGVNNPFYTLGNAYPQVNLEQVLAQPIQLIIQPLSDKQTDKQGFDWQQWPTLPAVHNQQIIRPDADKMHRMTLRALDELASLCQRVDKVRQFYRQKFQ